MLRHVLAVAAGALVLSPAAAHAGDFTVSVDVLRAKPGQKARFAIDAAGTRSCTIKAGKARRTVALPGRRRITVRFAVSRRARAGRHVVTVTCAGARTAGRLPVIVAKTPSNRAGRPVTNLTGRFTTTLGAFVADGDSERPADDPTSGEQAWTRESAYAEAGRWYDAEVAPWWQPRNGQCTDWAYQRRPDFHRTRVVFHYAEWLLAGKPVQHPDVPKGSYVMPPEPDTKAWAAAARGAGMATGTQPRAGAIWVQPHVSETGHVAYVEVVHPDGSFGVSEYNYDNQPGVRHDRTIQPGGVGPDDEFIY